MKKTLAMIFAFLLTTYSMPYSPVSATEGKGDVNADGKFSTADIVSLQKWLLAESNTKLADWQAGDFSADEKLNAQDLCLMRQALVSPAENSPLEKLVGMTYADAVQNGYISKSEYNYQIAGELKSAIEEKMGRPLDYSVDRFYLVHSDAIGLSDTTQYLYNAATKDVYVVNTETNMNRATWYWKGSKATLYGIDNNMTVQNQFLDAMEFYGITEIYYSIGANKLVNNADMVATFVKNAYARNMKDTPLGCAFWRGQTCG